VLYNYGAGEAASVVSAASISGGNTTIALSDGTHIEFVDATTALLQGHMFST